MENRQFEPTPSQRRSNSRLQSRLTATITSLSGTQHAILENISKTGAKLSIQNQRGIDEPLRKGQTVVINWDKYEVLGDVAWVFGSEMGLHFDEEISLELLVATRNLVDQLGRRDAASQEAQSYARAWVEGKS